MNRLGISQWLVLICLVGNLPSASAVEKTEGTLTLNDALTYPNHTTRIEAKLTEKTLLVDKPLGGEPVELSVEGKPAATAMTGGDGRAFLEYVPKRSGVFPMSAKLGASPRIAPAETSANLYVWERRRPILLVESAALIEEGRRESLPLPSLPGDVKPHLAVQLASDAPEELGRLSRFYYNLIYVAWPGDENGDHINSEILRRLMRENRLPVGYVLSVKPGRAALESALDDLKQQGWSMMKAGIGRTSGFAEALLDQRMEVVIVPEPRKGELPRKAKSVKEWKEVRKKL